MKRWRSAAGRRICQLTGQQSVEDAVVEIARRLTDGLEHAPIELSRIFPRVRIRACRPDPELMVSGELRKLESGDFEIVIASEQPPVRQRFTIGHEIAHAVFEHTGARCPRRGRELERICDMIASEILTPKRLFREAAQSVINLAEVQRLAETFGVSVTSAAIRCSDVFGTLVSQVEDGDIRWLRGRTKYQVRSLRPQLKIAAIDAIKHLEHDKDVAITADSGETFWMRMQSVNNGDGRTLFLFSPSSSTRNGTASR